MAWLTAFKLGRPGYEVLFDVNPGTADMETAPVELVQRNLAGDLAKSIVKPMAPTIRINSNYLTKAQRDQFESLRMIDDTFLSFQMRNDFQVLLQYHIPTSLNTITLKNTSATRLSAALIAAGFSTSITIVGVFDNPSGTGTNYYSGGSYADATRVITLGIGLPSTTAPAYVTYTYLGWLVNLSNFSQKARGGLVDTFGYDIELQGA